MASGTAGAPSGSGSGGVSGTSSSGTQTGSGSSGTGSKSEGAHSKAVVYEVNATWQLLSASGAPVGAMLRLGGITQRLRPLPSGGEPLFEYLGVSEDGRSAVFMLLVAPILHGEAKCLPGPDNCEMIALEPKHSEEMQYLQTDGEVLAYRLSLDSIVKRTVSAGAALAHASSAGSEGQRIFEAMRLTIPEGISFSA